MRWRLGRQGSGIEDRRGMGGGKMAGGGLVAIVIMLIGYFVFGIDPFVTQQLISGFDSAGMQQQGEEGTPQDEAGLFVDIISANINDVWSARVTGYQPPRVVLYEQGTQTGCGFGQSAMGPFYCPNDATVYLDLGFWREMETQLGASGADFARAYVVAHEFGHHVQHLVGTAEEVRRAQQGAGNETEANRYSVALELQADCYAGVWSANASEASGGRVSLEAGDLDEGLKTANAIGDDALQRKATGRVTPEGFTHGTSAQRVEWLNRGYNSGDAAQCDTFAGM
jgi:predicted metalloprotease